MIAVHALQARTIMYREEFIGQRGSCIYSFMGSCKALGCAMDILECRVTIPRLTHFASKSLTLAASFSFGPRYPYDLRSETAYSGHNRWLLVSMDANKKNLPDVDPLQTHYDAVYVRWEWIRMCYRYRLLILVRIKVFARATHSISEYESSSRHIFAWKRSKQMR